MKKVRFQKERKPLILTFSDAEVQKMARFFSGSRYLDIRNKLIMMILFDTGIRNFELCNLKLTDVRETYILIHGKGKKDRIVPIVPISPILSKQLIKYDRVRDFYIKTSLLIKPNIFFYPKRENS